MREPEPHVLHRLLSYDAKTGIFRWRVRPSNNMRAGMRAGCPGPKGWIIRIGGQNYAARRLAWLMTFGYLRKEIEVFNRNGDVNDTRLANLSISDAQDRTIRRKRMAKPSGPSEKNIRFRCGFYEVQLYRDGRIVHKSRHPTFEDAVAARDGAKAIYDAGRLS